MPYSGGDPINNIQATVLPNYTVDETVGDIPLLGLNGVALNYTGGSICPETGKPRTFTVNVMCKSGVEGNYTGQVLGDPCNPHVNLVSEYGCTVLDVSVLWEYLAKYSDYFGAFLLLIGLLLTFCGRKLIRPSVCIAGFLTCVFVACFIFYAVFLTS